MDNPLDPKPKEPSLELDKPLEGILPEVTPEEKPPEPTPTPEKIAAGMESIKTQELKSLAEALTLLSSAVAEVKTLSSDLKADLQESGRMKEELAFAIAETEKLEKELAEKVEAVKAGTTPAEITPAGTPQPPQRKKTRLF